MKLYCTPGCKWSGNLADYRRDISAEGFSSRHLDISSDAAIDVPERKGAFIEWCAERDLIVDPRNWHYRPKDDLIAYLNRMEVNGWAEPSPPISANEVVAMIDGPLDSDPDHSARISRAIADTETASATSSRRDREIQRAIDIDEAIQRASYEEARRIVMAATERMVECLAEQRSKR